MLRSTIPAALAAISIVCCSTPGARVVLESPVKALQAIVVSELEIGYDADAFESAKRTHDVLDALWRESSWHVITPREFRFLDPKSENFLHGTDLVIRARALGLDPRKLSMLTGIVSIREARGQATVTGGAGIAVGRDYQATVVVSLELLTMEGTPLVQVEHQRVIDPFAERPDYDDRPEIRAGIRRAVRELIKGCGHCFVATPRPAFVAYTNPVLLLDLPHAKGGTLRQQIAAAGPLERDQLLWRTMQYVWPDLDLPDAQRLSKAPPGACIAGEPQAGLRLGDCIIAIDGEPVDGVHSLGRALTGKSSPTLTVIGAEGRQRSVSYSPTP
ncbi:MAG: hypothetical protein V3T05_03730 [Myxococcota bacterium]